MNYALKILKQELKNEKTYKKEHEKILKEDNLIVSDKRVFKISVRLAEKRIPQLNEAITKLTPSNTR